MPASDSVDIIRLVNENSTCQTEWNRAKSLDLKFMKESRRKDFNLPKSKQRIESRQFYCLGSEGEEYVYICGNSLGPQPKAFNSIIMDESDTWAKQ